MSWFEQASKKIEAQQKTIKERSAPWMVGQQLRDMIRGDERASEIVAADLDNQALGLAACEKKIKAFADGHRTGSFACVTHGEAEAIIREFYGIADKMPVPATGAGLVFNIEDFL